MDIILMDDHALFTSTLKNNFDCMDSVESVKCVVTEDELNFQLKKNPKAVVLLDINLKGIGIDDSISLAERTIVKHNDVKIAFLSGYDKPIYRKKAKSMGAKGFFSKIMSFNELMRGVECINNGGEIFLREDARTIEKCTPMEVLILKMAAMGMSRNEIAIEIGISIRTVSTHLTSIFGKLDVKNITEAVAVALQEGHIPPLF